MVLNHRRWVQKVFPDGVVRTVEEFYDVDGNGIEYNNVQTRYGHDEALNELQRRRENGEVSLGVHGWTKVKESKVRYVDHSKFVMVDPSDRVVWVRKSDD